MFRRRGWPRALDPAIAGLLCVLDLFVSWDRDSSGVATWVTPAYAVAGYLPLVWRRRFPRSVFAVVVAHSLLAWVVVPGYVPTLGVWLALYTVAACCGRRAALLALLAALAATALNVADEVRGADPGNRADALVVASVLGSMFDFVFFSAGRWVSWTGQQRRLEARRAALDAVTAERGRIARDLHDIVAHAVSLMVLQSGGAGRVLRQDPDRAETALRHVDELGQQAIAELRRMLGLLASVDDRAPTSPSGLRDVDGLVAHLRAAGMDVRLDVVGAPAILEAGVDLSAYRIVQEALTNSAKHADRQFPVQVEVRWRTTEVEVRVRNRTRPTRRSSVHPLSTGNGLIGMRERAGAVEGHLEAGLQPDGDFLVTARFTAAEPVPVPWTERTGLPLDASDRGAVP